MPELPEVETTVRGINRKLKNLHIIDVWTDYFSPLYKKQNQIKNRDFFNQFKKKVVGTKIVKANRRAKNILIELSNGNVLLVHMKMTGHLLYGKYKKQKIKNEKRETWVAVKKGPLRDDSYNQFIHLVFSLSNNKHLVLSDVRKFAKVTLISTENIKKEFANFGPEPLNKNFKLQVLKDQLAKKPNGKIKQVLMDQNIISGIGNIYSDEALWLSGVHPLRKVSSLKDGEIKNIWINSLFVLKKGISFGGDSLSDYRNIDGERGKFQHEHKVYGRKGSACQKRGCKGTIERIKVGGRSAHFCPKHQI